MKKTWGILKNINNRNKTKKIQSQFKLNDGSITSNKLVISDKFNDFFINIGPTLANKIPKQSKLPEAYLGSKIENYYVSTWHSDRDWGHIQDTENMLSWIWWNNNRYN